MSKLFLSKKLVRHVPFVRYRMSRLIEGADKLSTDQESFQRQPELDKERSVTGYGHVDACGGDSGGPNWIEMLDEVLPNNIIFFSYYQPILKRLDGVSCFVSLSIIS